jgi:hypothetical protein
VGDRDGSSVVKRSCPTHPCGVSTRMADTGAEPMKPLTYNRKRMRHPISVAHTRKCMA